MSDPVVEVGVGAMEIRPVEQTIHRNGRQAGVIDSRARWVLLMLLCFAMFTMSMGGCGERRSSTEAAADDDRSVRIVSLSPAVSRALVDCGLGDLVVGRTRWCEAIDAAVPVIGALDDLDFESLIRVRPTHVVVQPSALGVDPGLRKAVEGRGGALLTTSSINSINDVADMVDSLGRILPENHPRHDEVAKRAAGLAAELRSLRAAEPVWSGRVLMVSGGDGLLAFGRDTYLNDLVGARGGRNVINSPGWVTLTEEDALRLDPDAIIVIRPGWSAQGDPRDALGVLGSLDLPAVSGGRIGIISDPGALLPSTSLIGIAAEIDRMLSRWSEREPEHEFRNP